MLICFRKVYSIPGTNSHRFRSKIGGLTLVSAWKYCHDSRLCQLLLVLLRGIQVSYQKSERHAPLKIVLATSLQSFKAIEPKLASQSVTFNEKVGDVTLRKFCRSKVRPHCSSPSLMRCVKLRNVSKPWPMVNRSVCQTVVAGMVMPMDSDKARSGKNCAVKR